jgi:valyl-tRNA synthetase
MWGDVALAVNPGDSRYAKFIGKNVVNPLNENIIPIIGDARVKTEFGTG